MVNLEDPAEEDKDDENPVEQQDLEEPSIRWITIIFLPYQSWWQWIIIYIVFVKCFFAPLNSISQDGVQCVQPTWPDNPLMQNLLFSYLKLATPIYLVDTFFYIIHRQVVDEAMKREYAPKAGLLIILDIISLMPLFEMFADNQCIPIEMWPYILNFNELLIVYRIWNFFSLSQSHNYCELFVGYFLLFIIILNGLTCFMVMWTRHGLCSICSTNTYRVVYDWRSFAYSMMHAYKFSSFIHYFYANGFVLFQITNKLLDSNKPFTYTELGISIVLMMLGYLIILLVFMPKLFGEGLLRAKTISRFQPKVKRIIEETQRRNPSPQAAERVESFYSIIWKMGKGITTVPSKLNELPRYMRTEIGQDLAWSLFHHSPTFRNTSIVYKRWLSQFIDVTCKQPGDSFFSRSHCHTNLYYLRSGIVQLFSTDDSASAVLSFSEGTIFGDVSFYIPPTNRYNLQIRCLTYSEVVMIPRVYILKSLHKFPEDRREILKLVRERLKHAHDLFNIKLLERGEDRTKDEGLQWLKTRWWEISEVINKWKMISNKIKKTCELPPEEQDYHCAKYIGQLVLCSDIKLQKKSMFTKIEFPCVFAQHSAFINVWSIIIKLTVYLMLLLHPPNILTQIIHQEEWFQYLVFFTDVLFVTDIFVSLSTSLELDDKTDQSFTSVAFQRCQKVHFLLDLLSTPLFEYLLHHWVVDSPICQYNRVIKAYVLFFDKRRSVWNKTWNLMSYTNFKIILVAFVSLYVPAFMMYMAIKYTWVDLKATDTFFFNHICIEGKITSDCDPILASFGSIAIFIQWISFVLMCVDRGATTLPDLVIGNISTIFYKIINLYLSQRFISTLFMQCRDKFNYQYFVTDLRKHYLRLKIHPDLLKRLDRYLICHWKYYNGSDILYPNMMRDEPYDIFQKGHEALAHKVIGESQEFIGANIAMINFLADKANYLILPKNSTLIMLGVPVENVMWVIQGTALAEYQDEKDQPVTEIVPNRTMLSMLPVFLNRSSLRTYTSITDVEILYIKACDFNLAFQRYPFDSALVKECKKEIVPMYDDLYVSYMKKHKEYQKQLRDRIFHEKKVEELESKSFSDKISMDRLKAIHWSLKIPAYFKNFRRDPEALITLHWFAFRAVIMVTSFFLTILKDMVTGTFATVCGWIHDLSMAFVAIDIIIKFFIPYYDERGIVITHIGKCALHYLTRNFIVDVAGSLLRIKKVVELFSFKSEIGSSLFQKAVEVFHLYLLTGFLNYYANRPSINALFLLIIKWQIILVMVILYGTYFSSQFCINFNVKKQIRTYQHEGCWMPLHYKMKEQTDARGLNAPLLTSELALILIEGLRFTTNALLLNIRSHFNYAANQFVAIVHHLCLAAFFWYQKNYCMSLLVLYYRGHTTCQQDVNQLKTFLKTERVPKNIIEKSENHFIYWWKRTEGVDVKILRNERIGVVFKQDLNYFFFKRTFQAVDTLLKGGEPLERMLASCVSENYYLPGEDIMRQNDLTPNVFIVHRGKVAITINDVKVATLTKGSIFGQLEGSIIRPSKVSAEAIDHADLLEMTVKEFQEAITDDVRKTIKRNKQSQQDYMVIKKAVPENPYNSIEYILRGAKTFKFPRLMRNPVNSESHKWYSRWLLLVWVIGPMASAAATLLDVTQDDGHLGILYGMLMGLDILHILHLLSDFFSMELQVINGKCVYEYNRKKKLKRPWIYIDLLSILPLLSATYNVARVLRIYSIFSFYQQFCKHFQASFKTTLLKLVCLLLLTHAMTCGWILVLCRHPEGGNFPAMNDVLPQQSMGRINRHEWIYRFERRNGCPRISPKYKDKSKNTSVTAFLTPANPNYDYLLALNCVVQTITWTNMEIMLASNIMESGYMLFTALIVYLVEIWFTSVVISSIYTMFREMYHFDYDVFTLLKFLQRNGVSKFLQETVKTYTRLLWQRQKGKWLPNITNEAPLCLQEDILSSLYMHHLLNASIFSNLPHYFLRQLAVRLQRVVIFPGKYIVQEGEIIPVIYFIHEGEVERWYTDKNGDARMSGLLAINGYFGLIPGLFPNTPFQYTYCTRTVVDVVYLRYDDWQDLLSGYPDIKVEIYSMAVKMQKEQGIFKHQSKYNLGSTARL